MESLLAVSRRIERLVEAVAMATAWLFVVLTAVILTDVVTRKFGYQLPDFGSTKLQELEWHLHAGLFAGWLGYAYFRNAHVRIDVVTSRLGPRWHAWLEFVGLLVFALPFCLIATYYAIHFAWISWLYNEASESASGLAWRFIPKTALAGGLLLLLVAAVGVLLRVTVYLFGPARLRAAAAFAGATAPRPEERS